MATKLLKTDKGVAGLNIFLSLIVMLFIIGLLVMVFALMGGGLGDTDMLKASETSTATQNNLTLTDAGTVLTVCNSQPFGTTTVITVINASSGATVTTGNYTISTCTLTATATAGYNATKVNVSYTYTYSGESYQVINDTVSGISGATDWFLLFIVIGAMIVLILLTVIIIVAIRQSGVMGGGEMAESGGSGGMTA